MGDCRIRILIAKDTVPAAAAPTATNDNDEWLVISHVAPADSTVRDVYDTKLKPIFFGNTLPDNICLWDCTLHPPKNITGWLVEFGARTGPQSKTLFAAGWFPSGTWQVLPQGRQPSRTKNYDDVQYNLPSESTDTLTTTSAVHLTSGDIMTPSQVLQSVTQRFPETNPDEERKQAMQVRRQKLKEKKEKEAKRHARLEERVRKLDANSKQSNVSKQVRRMLIKSRCTGSQSLKMQDRVYLRFVVVEGEKDTREEFRYFSQQDTVARIVSAVANDVHLHQEAELLVKCTDNGGEVVYRRLPVAMRLYEAITANHIEEVDAVVIRYFTPPEEDPTTSVDEVKDEKHADTEMEEDGDGKEASVSDEAVSASNVADSMEVDTDTNEIFTRMAIAVSAMDDAASAKSKKKASSTSDKVRTMLMKSKAKGDKKRVPKMEDRMLMELVVVEDFNGQCSATASPVFLAKSDTVERVLRDCVSVPSDCSATIYVPTEQGSFLVLTGDVTWQDAEAGGLVKCFDRVVVRLFKG